MHTTNLESQIKAQGKSLTQRVVLAGLAVMLISLNAVAQDVTVGTNSLTFGHGAGTGTLVIGAAGDWTASTQTAWLHIPDTSTTGTGNALFQFTYDANFGLTRTGTITFTGGANVTVTQAGANYVPSYELTTLVSSGLSTSPSGLAVDSDGNVYIADVDGIKEWNASSGRVSTLLPGGNFSAGVAVDPVGNAYFPDQAKGAIDKRDAQTGQITALVSGLTSPPTGVAVDLNGNVYFCAGNAVEEWTASTGQVTSLISSGLNFPGGVAVDADGNLYVADIGSGAAFPRNDRIQKWTAATGQLTLLVTERVFQLALAVDGDGNVYFSNANSVREWTASTGEVATVLSTGFAPAGGIAVDAANNLYFGLGSNIYRWNAGTGDLTPLVPAALNAPHDVAVDSQGNVYIADGFNFDQGAASVHTVKKWTAATGTVTTLLSTELSDPLGLAVNAGGDLFIADRGQVVQWTAATGQVTPLLSDGAEGVAVDLLGNVYMAASGNNAIDEWTASTGQLTTLVSSGLQYPTGVAVDVAGNVYIADTFNNAVKEWNAATGSITTLVSSGLTEPRGIAVDGTGTAYFNDTRSGAAAIRKWSPDTNQVIDLPSPGMIFPQGMAVDSIGNIYVADAAQAVKRLTHAFVAPSSFVEPLGAGSDQFLPVLPVGTPLDATSDQPWLTIASQVNGVITFSFTATATERTGHIAVLGQSIPVTQRDNTLPTVVSYSVLWGSENYSLTDSPRNNLPWQISGIQVLFSKPITTATIASLRGVQATALSGLGTNTLTWTIDPVTAGSFALTLAQDGPDAVMDADGNTLTGNVNQSIRVLSGDYNDDGTVDATDLTGVNLGRSLAYNIFADMDGNGLVDINDLEIVRTRIGATLP